MSSLANCFVIFAVVTICQSYTITSCSSGNTCTCQSGESCTVDCNGSADCNHATIDVGTAVGPVNITCSAGNCMGTTINGRDLPLTITCSGRSACESITINAGNHDAPFTMTCTGDTDSCYQAKINAGNASSVNIYCETGDSSEWACDNAVINCGTGTGACTIHCNGDKACEWLNLDCGSSSECTLRCDYGQPRSCRDLLRFDCGVSVCSIYCDNAIDSCLNTQNNNPIYPNVTTAISFQCIGDGCATEYMDSMFTVSPTNNPSSMPGLPTDTPSSIPTNIPSIIPSKLPSTIPSNIPSFSPTIIPTTAISYSPSLAPSEQQIVTPTISIIPTIIATDDIKTTSNVITTQQGEGVVTVEHITTAESTEFYGLTDKDSSILTDNM